MGSITQKTCTKCGETKSTDNFHKDKNRGDGYFPQCKACVKEKTRRYYRDNKDAISAKNKAYRMAHPEDVLRRAKDWVLRNREKRKEIANRCYYKHKVHKPAIERNPTIEKEIADEKRRRSVARACAWNKAHPESKAICRHNRRALIKGAVGKITAREWIELKEFYGNTCLGCGKKEPEIKLTLDHVLPLKLGGENSINNAQPLCLSCNCSKQAKHIDYRRRRRTDDDVA